MRRLRDKRTGEVYGWGPAMAAIPTMEEFDDGGEDPDAKERDRQAAIRAELDRRGFMAGRDIVDPRLDVNGDGNARGDPTPEQVRESRIAAGLDPDTGAPLGHAFDLEAYEAALAEQMKEAPPHLVARPDPGITPERAALVSTSMPSDYEHEYHPPVAGAGGVVDENLELGGGGQEGDEQEARPARGRRARQPREGGRNEVDNSAAME
jgi:hypothetical protein